MGRVLSGDGTGYDIDRRAVLQRREQVRRRTGIPSNESWAGSIDPGPWPRVEFIECESVIRRGPRSSINFNEFSSIRRHRYEVLGRYDECGRPPFFYHNLSIAME